MDCTIFKPGLQKKTLAIYCKKHQYAQYKLDMVRYVMSGFSEYEFFISHLLKSVNIKIGEWDDLLGERLVGQ